MFDNYALEFLLLKNSFAENQLLQMEFLSSLIVVSFILWIVYRGLRYKKIRECFAIHKYEKEPENAIERFKLYVDAPLLSGNGICMWRVYASIPLAIITVIFYKETVISSILLQFYVFLFVTDALDGAVARSLNNVTQIGKSLDPFADKFLDLIILGIVCLFSNNSFFVLVAFLICIIDIAGQNLRAKTSNPAANWVGKTKTVFKVITIYVVSLNRFDLYLDYIGGTLLVVSAIFTFASFYLKVKDRLHLRFWRKRKTPRMRGVFDYINQYLFIYASFCTSLHIKSKNNVLAFFLVHCHKIVFKNISHVSFSNIHISLILEKISASIISAQV